MGSKINLFGKNLFGCASQVRSCYLSMYVICIGFEICRCTYCWVREIQNSCTSLFRSLTMLNGFQGISWKLNLSWEKCGKTFIKEGSIFKSSLLISKKSFLTIFIWFLLQLNQPSIETLIERKIPSWFL